MATILVIGIAEATYLDGQSQKQLLLAREDGAEFSIPLLLNDEEMEFFLRFLFVPPKTPVIREEPTPPSAPAPGGETVEQWAATRQALRDVDQGEVLQAQDFGPAEEVGQI